MEDNYNQQPREKSFWSSVGDFFLNALIIIGSIVSVVGIATIFSDTVSGKIDQWTQDKDGKGGWGSWLRQKAGVSTEQETSATDKIGQMTDKLANKGKEYFNKGKKLFGFDTPSENQETTPPANNQPSNNNPANDQPAADKQKEGFGVVDGAGLLLLYGVGKKAFDKLNPRVHVDEAGNIHSITTDQVKAEKAVAQATKDIDEARRIQKEAQLKADSLKGPKIMEDEANNKKRWYQRGVKTANKEYNNALKALEKANSSVTNLTTVIEEGNKVISTGQPSNNSRLRAYMGKLFGGGAGAAAAVETEFGTIEHATAKPAAGATAAAPTTTTTNTVKVPGMGDISATPQSTAGATATPPTTTATNTVKVPGMGDISATPQSTAGATATPPTTTATNTVKVPGMGDISATPQSTAGATATPPTTTATNTVKVPGMGDISATPQSTAGATTPTDPNAPKLQGAATTIETEKAAASLSETLNSMRAGGGRVLSALGSVLTPAAVVGTVYNDSGKLHELTHTDEKHKEDRTGTATLQALATGIEAGGMRLGPIGFAAGSTIKDGIAFGHQLVTGRDDISHSFISDFLTDKIAGKVLTKEEQAAQRKAEMEQGGRPEAINAKIMQLSQQDFARIEQDMQKAKDSYLDSMDKAFKGDYDQLDKLKKGEPINRTAEEKQELLAARQKIVEAWFQKAADEGLNKIHPQALVEHVASHNWEMPPVKTPAQKPVSKDQTP